MAAEPLEGGEVRNRRARLAVAALFLTNGALFANLLPRFPEIKSDLAMSNAGYGGAVAAFSAGALLAGLTAAALIRRFASARVAVVTTGALAAFLTLAALAPSPAFFAAALFTAGACDAITDVAQNVNGLRLQRDYGRSIINSLHAVWAVGAITGGLMGAAAIALHIPRAVHVGGAGMGFCVVVAVAYRHLLRGPDHDNRPTQHRTDGNQISAAVYLSLAALVGIAIVGATVEDSELELPAGSCATNGAAQIDTMTMTAVGHHQLETVFDFTSMLTIHWPCATIHPCGRQTLSNESSWANLDASWVTFKKPARCISLYRPTAVEIMR